MNIKEAEGYKRELVSSTSEVSRLNVKINLLNEKIGRLTKKIE